MLIEERLQKFIARAGIASRRKAEELISAKAVIVNGQVAHLGQKVSSADVVMVNGQKISTEQFEPLVYMVNKPLNVVSTVSDEQDRPTVVSLVKTNERLYPVGRLDKNTSGLILLTNDGDLAYRLTHPKFEIEKEYIVKTDKELSENNMARLKQGIHISGLKLKADSVVSLGEKNYQIILHEGKNKEIRRMIQFLKREVVSLRRVRIGRLVLGDLKEGQSRLLGQNEIELLLS